METVVLNRYTPEAMKANRVLIDLLNEVAAQKAATRMELALEAAKLEIPKEPKLKDRTDFTIIGKSGKRTDVLLKTYVQAEFGIDVDVPRMLYAMVERCPVIGGTLNHFNASQGL